MDWALAAVAVWAAFTTWAWLRVRRECVLLARAFMRLRDQKRRDW